MGFAEDIKRWADRTKAQQELIVRYTVLNLAAEVIRRSPVDTGRFRGNWMLGAGAPNTRTVDIVDKSGGQSLSRFSQGEVKVGGKFFITNSLPYARRLEYGWSKQAPQGMVRLTVVNFEQHVRAAVERARK